ncbi:MAG: hypothetical protein IPK26_31655 [Planctomycetes bacterium]|nr:hypothetical protein [Planctomycetota bacterium]
MHKILLLALTAAVAQAQTLTIPDTQNTFNAGTSTTPWSTTAGLKQYIYDTSHFTNAGVIGPITINRLRFRAADGVRNQGGHTWAGVTVQLGTAAVDHLAMTTTYATNRGTMGPLSAPMAVTSLPVNGTWTNDTYIDIDLAANGAAFSYDPTLGSDLLIEIILPAAPTPTTNLAAVACSSTTANGRGQRCAGTIAGPGTLSGFVPVIKMDFVGPGGYTAPQGSWVENKGAGCGGQAQSFYQQWNFIGDGFDLRGGKSLTLFPDNPTTPSVYTVVGGTNAVDLSATALGGAVDSVGDDSVVTETPGFTFNFPGGSTTAFSACTNGFVWLGTNTVTDLSPSMLEFFNSMARVCMIWKDLHAGRNVTTNPTSGMYINTDLSGGAGNGVTYVTWLEIGEFSVAAAGYSVNTFQCVFQENGTIDMRWGAMNGIQGNFCITGFSRGGTTTVLAVDPGNRDLSHETPFTTAAEGTQAGMTLVPSIRPVLGVPTGFTLTHTLANMPATAAIAAVLLDFTHVAPGTPLPLGNPGCLQSILVPNTLDMVFSPIPAPWTTIGLPLPLGTSPDAGGWMGAQLYTQGVTLNIDGMGNLSTSSSNAIKLVLGLL